MGIVSNCSTNENRLAVGIPGPIQPLVCSCPATEALERIEVSSNRNKRRKLGIERIPEDPMKAMSVMFYKLPDISPISSYDEQGECIFPLADPFASIPHVPKKKIDSSIPHPYLSCEKSLSAIQLYKSASHKGLVRSRTIRSSNASESTSLFALHTNLEWPKCNYAAP